MLVSSYKCYVRVSLVHPMAMRSAVFCMACCLSVFVSDVMGDHLVLPFCNFVLVIAV